MATTKRMPTQAKPQKSNPGKTPAPRKGKAAAVDAYLAGIAPDKRIALEKLRQSLKKLLPKAEEVISYGVPALRDSNGVIVYFAASAKHCSLFPTSRPIEACAGDLKGYDTSKGTIRFPAEKGLPAVLLKKLMQACLAQMAEKRDRG